MTHLSDTSGQRDVPSPSVFPTPGPRDTQFGPKASLALALAVQQTSILSDVTRETRNNEPQQSISPPRRSGVAFHPSATALHGSKG